MATQDDIMRIDKDVAGIRSECTGKHKEISDKLTEMLVTIGRIEERQKQAYGELGKGDTAFTDHDKRLRAIETQLSNWKGWFAGMTAAATIAASILTAVVKIIWLGLSKL